MSKRTRFSGATSSLAAPKRKKNDFARSEPSRKSDRKRERSEIFPISNLPPYLQIQSVPIAERVDPERNTYILVIQPVGIRAAGGQYSASEAHEIARASRGWDWSLNENGQPQCLQRLEALLNELSRTEKTQLLTKLITRLVLRSATASEHLAYLVSKKGGEGGWDFSLNPDGQPQCWQELEALLNQICKRSAKGGES